MKTEALALFRATNQIEEEMYPMAVALGYVATEVLRSTKNIHEVGGLVDVANNSVKWSDPLDYAKKEIARSLAWRIALPNLDGYCPQGVDSEALNQLLTQYMHPGDGWGVLFLKVSEHYFLPWFIRFAREQGYDIASQNFEEAIFAHTIVVKLLRKMIDQMTTEYRYRMSFRFQRITDHFTVR